MALAVFTLASPSAEADWLGPLRTSVSRVHGVYTALRDNVGGALDQLDFALDAFSRGDMQTAREALNEAEQFPGRLIRDLGGIGWVDEGIASRDALAKQLVAVEDRIDRWFDAAAPSRGVATVDPRSALAIETDDRAFYQAAGGLLQGPRPDRVPVDSFFDTRSVDDSVMVDAWSSADFEQSSVDGRAALRVDSAVELGSWDAGTGTSDGWNSWQEVEPYADGSGTDGSWEELIPDDGPSDEWQYAVQDDPANPWQEVAYQEDGASSGPWEVLEHADDAWAHGHGETDDHRAAAHDDSRGAGTYRDALNGLLGEEATWPQGDAEGQDYLAALDTLERREAERQLLEQERAEQERTRLAAEAERARAAAAERERLLAEAEFERARQASVTARQRAEQSNDLGAVLGTFFDAFRIGTQIGSIFTGAGAAARTSPYSQPQSSTWFMPLDPATDSSRVSDCPQGWRIRNGRRASCGTQ